MRTGIVIPSLGAPHLEHCLEAVAALDPLPDIRVLVVSGGAKTPPSAENFEVHRSTRRVGFAEAVNNGIAVLPAEVEMVAVLNDDATPDPTWFGALANAFDRQPELAAVQGTVVDAAGTSIDGRGIDFDRYGLPVQVDQGMAVDDDEGERPVLAVSGTACLLRRQALREVALSSFEVFDQRFDSYYEDVDLGLRLHRVGRKSRWVGGARCRHLGSASGPSLRWHHPWWMLANRWRALAGNLSPSAFIGSLPQLLRGEIRAIRKLTRTNPRALVAATAVLASVPALAVSGWRRRSPGPRLKEIPVGPP